MKNVSRSAVCPHVKCTHNNSRFSKQPLVAESTQGISSAWTHIQRVCLWVGTAPRAFTGNIPSKLNCKWQLLSFTQTTHLSRLRCVRLACLTFLSWGKKKHIWWWDLDVRNHPSWAERFSSFLMFMKLASDAIKPLPVAQYFGPSSSCLAQLFLGGFCPNPNFQGWLTEACRYPY